MIGYMTYYIDRENKVTHFINEDKICPIHLSCEQYIIKSIIE